MVMSYDVILLNDCDEMRWLSSADGFFEGEGEAEVDMSIRYWHTT